MLKINEIFYSIQGESSYSGFPCIFIRMAGCNLDCAYCDTQYAKENYTELSIDEILAQIKKYNCSLVQITGGEPLIQTESFKLIKKLCKKNYTVLVETNGTISIKNLSKKVIPIIDIKCPSSKEHTKFNFDNIKYLKKHHEIKFVISDLNDYIWAKNMLEKYKLYNKALVLFSTVYGKISPKELGELILRDNLKVKLQLQLHKLLELK